VSALKAGTVCYLVGGLPSQFGIEGRVVTLSGGRGTNSRGESTWLFDRPVYVHLTRALWELCGAEPEYLRPINDPDQPVDVTSDTDEPVTA
jgi:hypothetical protein